MVIFYLHLNAFTTGLDPGSNESNVALISGIVGGLIAVLLPIILVAVLVTVIITTRRRSSGNKKGMSSCSFIQLEVLFLPTDYHELTLLMMLLT